MRKDRRIEVCSNYYSICSNKELIKTCSKCNKKICELHNYYRDNCNYCHRCAIESYFQNKKSVSTETSKCTKCKNRLMKHMFYDKNTICKLCSNFIEETINEVSPATTLSASTFMENTKPKRRILFQQSPSKDSAIELENFLTFLESYFTSEVRVSFCKAALDHPYKGYFERMQCIVSLEITQSTDFVYLLMNHYNHSSNIYLFAFVYHMTQSKNSIFDKILEVINERIKHCERGIWFERLVNNFIVYE